MDNYFENNPNWEKVLARLNQQEQGAEALSEFTAEETELLAELEQIKAASASYDDSRYFNTEAKWKELLQQIAPKKAKLWPRWASIAAAVAAIAFGTWFYTSRHLDGSGATRDILNYANDIAPGKQGATLTLANGKRVYLTDAANGQLAQEAGVQISKSADGQLVYEIKGSTEANKINTLSTEMGQTYTVTLPDKSMVWLNASSSLTYSATLNERGVRRVRLEGEAYFEVTKDKAHPFVVETKGQQVEVLGTHFNINSYANEPATVTTLIEGSVKVSSGLNKELLKPGYQAINTGKAIKVTEANIDNTMDWKNGGFYLDGVDFKVAMRKIARWYNVEVVYDASVPGDIETGGWISRDKSLIQVLKFIETSGLVHFKVEEQKIYVSK